MAEQKHEAGKVIFFVTMMGGLFAAPYLLGDDTDTTEVEEPAKPAQLSQYQLETLMYGCMFRYKDELVNLRSKAVRGWGDIANMRERIRHPVTDTEVAFAKERCCDPEGVDPTTCKAATAAHVRKYMVERFNRMYPGKPIESPRELEERASR